MKRRVVTLSGEVREYEVLEVALARREACCGLPAVKESTPLGKIYSVLPETINTGALSCAKCGKPIESVLVHEPVKGLWTALPACLFDTKLPAS